MATPDPAEQGFDLVFVGAGISTAFTLRALVDELRSHPPLQPVRIGVVEPSPDVFTGVAYGSRSGSTARIITPLDEFMAPAERGPFVVWLQQHLDQALADFEAAPTRHSTAWLLENREAIARGECDHLCLPRSLFGQYVRSLLDEQLEQAELDGLIDLTIFEATATSVDRDGNGFTVRTDVAGTVTARGVVLAVGIPPGPSVFADLDAAALMIEQPYEPGLIDVVDRVAARVSTLTDRPPRMLIVGANATMLDLLYQFEDHPVIASTGPLYCVLSHRGELPSRLGPPEGRRTDLPHLEQLAGRTAYSANDIHEAVIDDLGHHGSPPNDAGWLIPAINHSIGELVTGLSADEQRVFANVTGTEIGRSQRRAGADYYRIIDQLDAAGRLNRHSGSFDRRSGEIRLDRAGPAASVSQHSYDVLINASGSSGIGQGRSSLLDSIANNELATTTESRAGFVVNDRFEASPGLYVMGPLLAGNVLKGRPIWHLEHAGRIIKMSSTLGRQLGQSYRR